MRSTSSKRRGSKMKFPSCFTRPFHRPILYFLLQYVVDASRKNSHCLISFPSRSATVLSEMSSWITDPELFLYTKESDAYLWRCKTTSRVPMIPEDFEDLGKVTDHYDLVGDIFEWERADYDALVAYISPRRLLVNGQGLVIAELYKFGHDGNNIDPSQKLPCCYIRSLDVLNMKTYIPNLRERLIPSRTVQYLEEDGRAARVIDGASIEREAKEALEKEVFNLKAANETLNVSMTKLIVDLVAQSSAWGTSGLFEARKKTMESIIAAQTADKTVFTLQQVMEQVTDELERVKSEMEVRRIADIQAQKEAQYNAAIQAEKEAQHNNDYRNYDSDEYPMYGNGI